MHPDRPARHRLALPAVVGGLITLAITATQPGPAGFLTGLAWGTAGAALLAARRHDHKEPRP